MKPAIEKLLRSVPLAYLEKVLHARQEEHLETHNLVMRDARKPYT